MLKKNKKGFTLIELLVVIAIIGLLATLSVVALNNARERARDSRRVSDVRQIQTALELYFNAENEYPDFINTGKIETSNGVVLLDPVPEDPGVNDGGCFGGGQEYWYKVNSSNSEYCLAYCLGNDTGGIEHGLGTDGYTFATRSTISASECPPNTNPLP